jgi:hypothetical protein
MNFAVVKIVPPLPPGAGIAESQIFALAEPEPVPYPT